MTALSPEKSKPISQSSWNGWHEEQEKEQFFCLKNGITSVNTFDVSCSEVTSRVSAQKRKSHVDLRGEEGTACYNWHWLFSPLSNITHTYCICTQSTVVFLLEQNTHRQQCVEVEGCCGGQTHPGLSVCTIFDSKTHNLGWLKYLVRVFNNCVNGVKMRLWYFWKIEMKNVCFPDIVYTFQTSFCVSLCMPCALLLCWVYTISSGCRVCV